MNCRYCGEPSLVWTGYKFEAFIPAEDAKSVLCGFCVAMGALKQEQPLPEPEEINVKMDLKKWRNEKKVTQTDLANMLGVKQVQISKVESKQRSMPPDWVPKIIKIYPRWV